MGLQELGALAGFLGGMQQGKMLKQKKELTAQQLQARKAEAEQRAADRAATATYRANQIALQTAQLGAALRKEDREALGLDDIWTAGTKTRDKIAGVVAARSKELDEAASPSEYKRRLTGIRETVAPDIASIRALSNDPSMRKKFPTFTPQQIEGLLLSGIPEYAKNPNVDYGEPDYLSRYNPRDAKYQFNLNVEKLRAANINDPTYYAQSLLPFYRKIMTDLEGVPNVEKYAVSALGQIPGYTMAQTEAMLRGVNPRMWATPEQMNVQDVQTSDLGGAFDQNGLPLRYGNEVQFAMPGTELPQDLDVFQQKYPLLFDPNSYPDVGEKPVLDDQGQPNYVRTNIGTLPVGVSVATQTAAGLMGPRIEAAQVKAQEAKYALPEKLRKLALTNEVLEERLQTMPIDRQIKIADKVMKELRAANYDQELGAKLEKMVTDALRNKTSIITALKKWESESIKNYSMAVSAASSNLQKAVANATNNMNIAPYIHNGELTGPLLEYVNSRDPKSVIPFNIAKQLGFDGVAAIANLKRATIAFEKAAKDQSDFESTGILKTRSIMDRVIKTVGGGQETGFTRPGAAAPAAAGGGSGSSSSGGGGARRFARPGAAASPSSGGGGVNVPRPQPN